MPRKKKDADLIPMPGEETFSEQPETSKPNAIIKDRVSVPLKADGSIDFDGMRESTKEKLQKALSNSGNLGVAPVSALRVNRDFIPHMYGSLCAGIQLGGQKLFHWPEELTRHMKFTDEELETLKEPTAKVLEKHAPTWLLTHQEEFALAQAVIVVCKSMVERAATRYVIDMQAKPVVEGEPA